MLAGKTGATGTMTVPVAYFRDGRRQGAIRLTTTRVTVQAPDYSALFSIVDDGINLRSPRAGGVTSARRQGDVGALRRKARHQVRR